MLTAIIIVFVLGYASIAFEHQLNINKAASALTMGVLCWTLYIFSGKSEVHEVTHHLMEHMAEISSILFFLLGAMTIVEIIDLHDGFRLITDRIRTKDMRKLLIIISIITFFFSAILDNLTSTIVIVSLLRKLIEDREQRLLFVGVTVIAANAGGAWSPMGDVTTTMLWIGGQITAINIIKQLIIPSIVCLGVPLLFLLRGVSGTISMPAYTELNSTTSDAERKLVLSLGLGLLLFVPIFKTVTHLPPFMAILLGLGILWIVTELIHKRKSTEDRDFFSAVYALRKTDTPSILFFLGILLSISALESTGQLGQVATWLTQTFKSDSIIALSFGLLSAIVDNVPLVAAAQGMFTMDQYPTDHFLWEFLAYTTGTGGSILIIGSAAGVAAMGMEDIDFFWYIRRISILALIGYFAGAAAYVAQYYMTHS